MPTFTTVQSGSLADPATFGGSLPLATDHIVVAHTGCTVPVGVTVQCVNLHTGTAGTSMQVSVAGTLISTGFINPLRSTAVSVSSGGSLTANTVLANANWEGFSVVNNGGTVSINLISISINAQPGRGLLNNSGSATVNGLTLNSNTGTTIGIQVAGGTVDFSGSIFGGSNVSIATCFTVTGGVLNLGTVVSVTTTLSRRLIDHTGGNITVNNLTVQPISRQNVLINSTGGNLNFPSATLTVQSNALLEILKTNGQVDLTNCSIANNGNTLFRNVSGSTWIVDGLSVTHAEGSVLLSSNISNLQSQSRQGIAIGRLISGGV